MSFYNIRTWWTNLRPFSNLPYTSALFVVTFSAVTWFSTKVALIITYYCSIMQLTNNIPSLKSWNIYNKFLLTWSPSLLNDNNAHWLIYKWMTLDGEWSYMLSKKVICLFIWQAIISILARIMHTYQWKAHTIMKCEASRSFTGWPFIKVPMWTFS